MDTRNSSTHKVTVKGRAALYLPLVLAAFIALSCGAAFAANSIRTEVVAGKSAIMTLPDTVARVSLADPSIADVVVLTPKEIQINGKKIGSTSLIVWDKNGNKTFFDVDVIIDNSQLKERLSEAAPGDALTVKVAKDSVVVTGTVSSPDRLLRVAAILNSYKSEGLKVVNLVEIGETPQVLLQITVASIDRKATRDLGINWSNVSENLTIDSAVSSLTSGLTSITGLTAGATSPPLDTSGIKGATFGVVDWRNGTQYLLKALAGKGLAKILAEPNLLVKSGSTGTFLAGGEYPYPTIQSSGGGGTNIPITVEFKEFGIRMNFTPIVRESGIIQLNMGRPPQKTMIQNEKGLFDYVDTGEKGIEVSSLDIANAVLIAGTRVPALKKDAVSTNVDLREGETFIIAGLINEEWSNNMTKLPILGDIPILGAFFRDQSMRKTERELVFLVTPKLMKPMGVGERVELPGSNEPTAAQTDDMRWMPILPTHRSIDPEQLK